MKHARRLTRILCLLLLPALLLSLASCSKYRVEMSNEAQSRIVMTVGEYEVPFEVLYFFYKNTTESAATHNDRLAYAKGQIYELYALFTVAKARGVDPYGPIIEDEYETAVREMIDEFPTRREYIDALAARAMTDNVCRLFLRSYLTEARLLDATDGGSLVTDEELLVFCQGEDTVRALSMVVYYDAADPIQAAWGVERAGEITAALEAAADTDAAFLDIAHTMANGEDAHAYLSLSAWNRLTGRADTALPAVGTVSAPLFDDSGFLILRIAEKDLSYVENNTRAFENSYIQHLISVQADAFSSTATETAVMATLTEADFD